MGDALELCQGQQFVPSSSCGAGLCNAAEARCNSCLPGSSTCSGASKRQVCDAEGKGLSEEVCPGDAPLCDEGVCVVCKGDLDCKPSEVACRRAVCLNHQCELLPLKPEDPVPDTVPGDCLRPVCDLQGLPQTVPDPSDVLDDKNPCTKDICVDGVPATENIAAGTDCGGGKLCSGQGDCVVCIAGSSQCTDNKEEICASDGQQWLLYQTCKDGFVCIGVQCDCPTTTTCAGSCVDHNTDPLHCGDCFQACAASEVCELGQCVCPVAQCSGVCVDTTKDSANCGQCGVVCGVGEVCKGSSCECAVAECGGVCVDTQSDNANCGACGKVCNTLEVCEQGGCECSTTVCDGVCRDTNNDPQNCGDCGVVCPVACSEGKCVTVEDVEIGPSVSYAAPVCAIFSDKTVRCILHEKHTGGMPAPNPLAGSTPWYVDGLAKVKSFSVSVSHACAVLENGGVVCSGDNLYGQLGDGTTTSRIGFQPLSIPGSPSRVTVGGLRTGVIVGGSAWYAGYNPNDTFGVGFPSAENKLLTPSKSKSLPPSETVASLLVGESTSLCARSNQQNLFCWGSNVFGTLGRGENAPNPDTPGQVGLTGVTDAVLRDYHVCAVADDNAPGQKAVYCWGYNNSGQANAVDNVNVFSPVRITEGVGVAVGANHSCALQSDGKVTCWGANSRGQLGNGNLTESKTPVVVPGLPAVKKVAAAGATTCAVTVAGELRCWGAIHESSSSTTSPKSIFFPSIY